MTDDRYDDVDHVLTQLAGSPVGRRWLLKAGLTGAAVVALQGRAIASASSGLIAQQRPRRGRRVTLHFALGAAASFDGLEAHANGLVTPLTPHDERSRRRLRSGAFRDMQVERLTHHAMVEVPRDRSLIVTVHGSRNSEGVLVAQTVAVPREATIAVARAAYELEGSYRSVVGSPQRLAALGMDPSDVTSIHEVLDLETVVDSEQTAVTLTMMHPNVATVAPVETAATKSLLGQDSDVQNLGTYIGQMPQSGETYAQKVPAVDANGAPSQIKVGSTTTTFSTVQLNQTDSTFTGLTRSALVAGVKGVRDTGGLGKVVTQPIDELHDTTDTATWHQAEGVAPVSTPYVPPTGVGSSVQVKVTTPYPTLLYGTYTQAGELSGNQLPLTLYNNYVRWTWVYVQYLQADGTNLSLDSGASFPNTPYAQSVGLLPQIFTLLGIPIWDTNTITPTLNFPAEATGARLLFAGLGNQAIDGGWRQYFPADAYPDKIAPQGEVLFPALVTGIMTIGLTSFALLTDIDIAAAWGPVRNAVENNISDVGEILDAMLGRPPYLTAAESFSATVAAGGATYADIADNGGSAANIWSILLALGAIIPKVVFNPASDAVVAEIAGAILAESAAEKLIDAIPLIGQIIAVISAVGDAVTLAEAIGETISAPWVIANEISLQYSATVKVSPDGAFWPVTAQSWRLEATIDGATAISPNTGTLNEGGRIQSDPVEVSLTVPFGGNSITWSFVALDEGGNQVGTGTTKLANNDQTNPPSTVDFAIVELPAVISASSVFQRNDTTVYDPTVGGYTWSDAVADTGTLAASGVQEVTGVTISTALGVAGIVWKQNDQYWLRGVPIVENGNTITLGGATRQGYARRPFLLFDSFVGAGDAGNHVLLEPDDVGDSYQVRSLTIDPTTGALSWDPTASLGQFLLPVSAATLHSSGRVVTVHTDSGRLSHVLPAATPLPPLAAYSAGPGTEIGLLQSPTAVAVTNPGMVIVLAAGAAQLAAYDLAGNPVRYFGEAALPTYTLGLSTASTHLDVAVDGAANIYVLSYDNDGSQPSDYRVDVYGPTGTPIATNSPGTNIPHVAVDYWRSIFAANFTALLDASTGQPHIDPALGVAEPSLSRLDPT